MTGVQTCALPISMGTMTAVAWCGGPVGWGIAAGVAVGFGAGYAVSYIAKTESGKRAINQVTEAVKGIGDDIGDAATDVKERVTEWFT